ncbi:hypothetical protein ARMGADRAFT_1032664 [Armillaria gallica]|uniref:Uncharacterized protein n=1 Tax=Armillaria gallica TaxID=47427 RepID=A0A2H3DRJ3_ARMGA|nr:hypothetical protein ARMGADRAFT_1032664 [Armillaria gallica]
MSLRNFTVYAISLYQCTKILLACLQGRREAPRIVRAMILSGTEPRSVKGVDSIDDDMANLESSFRVFAKNARLMPSNFSVTPHELGAPNNDAAAFGKFVVIWPDSRSLQGWNRSQEWREQRSVGSSDRPLLCNSSSFRPISGSHHISTLLRRTDEFRELFGWSWVSPPTSTRTVVRDGHGSSTYSEILDRLCPSSPGVSARHLQDVNDGIIDQPESTMLCDLDVKEPAWLVAWSGMDEQIGESEMRVTDETRWPTKHQGIASDEIKTQLTEHTLVSGLASL